LVVILGDRSLARGSSAPAAASPQITDVFLGGRDGYPAYRIPALITTQHGSLLAFAEARASLRDHAENKIVMRRSTDAGETWGALQVIHGDGSTKISFARFTLDWLTAK